MGSVAGIAVIALGIAFVLGWGELCPPAASVITYEVEAITYGNVDTTISGSGNLTLSPSRRWPQNSQSRLRR